MFGLLKTTTLEFVGMRPEDGGVHSFAFRPFRALQARAGQHGLLTLPGAGTKAFSLASAPNDPEVLIGTRLQSGSAYKLALAALRPGQKTTLHGPILNFTLDPAVRQAVFLAQGVGITPSGHYCGTSAAQGQRPRPRSSTSAGVTPTATTQNRSPAPRTTPPTPTASGTTSQPP